MVSYERLLEVFWAEHNPSVPPWSKQYMSILFHHDERQKSAALRSRDRESARRMRRVFTEILPAREFYQAESYHQKYYLRRLPEILRELATLYPSDTDLTASTAAARLNGYLGGCGNLAMLEAALKKLDLPPEAGRKLLRHVPGGRH
ncbi:Methionine sulfoxide reductase A [Syntrophobacter fumaroxidans MPOB]|uniref:peptide-methionine (S)-S-oxide reductase n=1 Tax=Syntrophobacter fumaroxidans (strain DSM 10017 / MPOB) TaxID=335543 RepID=A0LKR1_SYNFM|nr:Methionine sulfoxide reductase A [Syntrophobacter fumaroxidans MPOB]